MKKMAMVFTMVLLLAGPASAALIWSDTYEAADTTWSGQGTVIIDGDFIVGSDLTRSGSFSGWGDLSGYSDLSATMTFTWHDENWNYWSFNGWVMSENNDLTNLPDLATVSMDGVVVFSDVTVGETGTTNPSTYTHPLTDLSMLDDDQLSYIVRAGLFGGSSRSDFVLDSITLTIEGTPSAVPVPGAVWLLGSGLLGLMGIRRRRIS